MCIGVALTLAGLFSLVLKSTKEPICTMDKGINDPKSSLLPSMVQLGATLRSTATRLPGPARLHAAKASFVLPLSHIERCGRDTSVFDIAMAPAAWPMRASLRRKDGAWERVELQYDNASGLESEAQFLLACTRAALDGCGSSDAPDAEHATSKDDMKALQKTAECETERQVSLRLVMHDSAGKVVAIIHRCDDDDYCTVERPGQSTWEIGLSPEGRPAYVHCQSEDIALIGDLASDGDVDPTLRSEEFLQIDVKASNDSPENKVILMCLLAVLVFCSRRAEELPEHSVIAEHCDKCVPKVPNAGASFTVPHTQIQTCTKEDLSFDIGMSTGTWPLRACLHRFASDGPWGKIDLTMDIAVAADVPPLLSCSSLPSDLDTSRLSVTAQDDKVCTRGVDGLDDGRDACPRLVFHDSARNLVGAICQGPGGQLTLQRKGQPVLSIEAAPDGSMISISRSGVPVAVAVGGDESFELSVEPSSRSPESAVLLMAVLALLVFRPLLDQHKRS